MTEAPLLRIEDLRTHFFTDRGVVRAVDGVDLTIRRGETLGVVGESGCGKSVTMLSILRMVASPPGRIVGGRAIFDGKDLLTISTREMQRIRGDRIAMIPQDPMAALNPVFTIGEQLDEVLTVHRGMTRAAAREESIQLLATVGIPSPRTRVRDYPHHFSGGMSQRVMIAMALACHPELVIADEPTTALDVTIQAQILDLLRGLIQERGAAIALITHDLGVVAEICDQVAVMYAGKIVEYTDVTRLFDEPLHPYTEGLHNSIPSVQGAARGRLQAIPGQPPDAARLPSGCAFRARCPRAMGRCAEAMPQLREVRPGHWARCFLHDPAPEGEVPLA